MPRTTARLARQSTPLRLVADFIPPLYATANLRYLLAPADWDRIRRQTYAEGGHKCSICHYEGPLEAHEQWEFDAPARLLRLTGILALCRLCHRVKHVVRSEYLANQGRFDREGIVTHFMTVNGCSRAAFDRHLRERVAPHLAVQEADEHGDPRWWLDLGTYTDLADLRRLVKYNQAQLKKLSKQVRQSEEEGTPMPRQPQHQRWDGVTEDEGIWGLDTWGCEIELHLVGR
jgi:hypothetical protein